RRARGGALRLCRRRDPHPGLLRRRPRGRVLHVAPVRPGGGSGPALRPAPRRRVDARRHARGDRRRREGAPRRRGVAVGQARAVRLVRPGLAISSDSAHSGRMTIPEHSLLRTRPILVCLLAAAAGLTVFWISLYWPREYFPHLVFTFSFLAVSLGVVNWLREHRRQKSQRGPWQTPP